MIARRFGVSEQTLYRWRYGFLAGGETALTEKRNGEKAEAKRIRKLTRDLAERDRVIGELAVARRILEKTAHGSR